MAVRSTAKSIALRGGGLGAGREGVFRVLGGFGGLGCFSASGTSPAGQAQFWRWRGSGGSQVFLQRFMVDLRGLVDFKESPWGEEGGRESDHGGPLFAFLYLCIYKFKGLGLGGCFFLRGLGASGKAARILGCEAIVGLFGC